MSPGGSSVSARALTFDELLEVQENSAFQVPQNLFFRNQLDLELRRLRGEEGGVATGDYHGSFDPSGIRAAALFARVGVLVVAGGDEDDADAFSRVALSTGAGFRLLIAERELGIQLLARLAGHAQIRMQRSQPFLVLQRSEAVPPRDPNVRLATAADQRWLTRANLALNEEDLGIAPATVHRRLLKQRILDRIASGRSWVLEHRGKPVCKLELGSQGPAGTLLEGVFTAREVRGQGFARALVEQVCAHSIPKDTLVGLHCSRSNVPAVRAYEAAGFREVADLCLACLQW